MVQARAQILSDKATLIFYGSTKQREYLEKEYSGISKEYDLQHVHEDREEPALQGCGAYARGWRQIGHVFDPAFDPL